MSLFSFEERHLGTPIVVQLVCASEAEAAEWVSQAFKECARIEALYSRFIDDNALSHLNAQLGERVVLEEEFFELLAFGERLRVRTEGAFDLSVKSILEGWGYDADYSFAENMPGEVGRMELGEGRRVRLSAPVELGGLGKGYAIDRMANVLSAADGVCINAGGDLFVRGHGGEGEPWRIVFEHPVDPTLAIGDVKLYGPLALAASSPSRRRWGKRHHLVDPRTGEPAQNMLGVYTQAPSALLADAYSTALFVLGFERAVELIPSLPVEAMLVGPAGQVFQSAGFKGDLFAE